MSPQIANLSRLPVTLVAIVLSCLFSLVTILQNPLLNNDAFSYLRAAEVFNAQGVSAVLDTYGWYAYSILIALADKLLPGDLVVAAHVLNAASYALLVHAFIGVCTEYRRTPRVRWFAALAILCFPLVNEMRYFLIRDIAFWAFAMLSLRQLMRFARDGTVRNALLWCAALFAAIAFRLEGLLLLGSAPLVLLFSRGADPDMRRRGMLLLQVALGGLALVLVLAFLAGVDLPGLVSYAYRFYLPLLGNLAGVVGKTAREVSFVLFTPENFPGADNTAMGLVIVVFAYAFTVAANFFNALSLPLVVLLAYGWRRRLPGVPAHCRPALVSYMTGSALALLLFVLIMHFLTQRYTTLLSLLMLTLVPLVLDELYERAQAAGGARRFRIALGAFAFYFLADSLVSFGYSKQYIEDAIAWTRAELAPGIRLHTNNYAIAYGSGRIPEYDRIYTALEAIVAESRSGDYLGLDVKGFEDDTRAWLDANPALEHVTDFANERGDAIRIYRRR